MTTVDRREWIRRRIATLEEASVLSYISKNLSLSKIPRGVPAGHDAAWDLMDRLMQDLDGCERANEDPE